MKKARVLRNLGLAALALTTVSTAVWPRAAYAVFRNWTAGAIPLEESPVWTGGKQYLSVPYALDSESQYLDLYVPKPMGGVLPKLFVLIHGGGFIAGDARTRQIQFMVQYFRKRGYACASVNYRLAQEAPFPAGLADCKAAIRFLRAHADEYRYDAEKIAVWGESAGGYLAVMCAVTNDEEFTDVSFVGQEEAGKVSARVDVLADWYGHIDNAGNGADWKALGIPYPVIAVANSWASGEVLQGYENVESFWMRKNLSAMTAEELALCDPYAYINRNDLLGLSAWIVHGDCDITVPYLHSERLAAALSEKLGRDAVCYRLIPGMGHASDPLYSDELLGALREFLDRAMND